MKRKFDRVENVSTDSEFLPGITDRCFTNQKSTYLPTEHLTTQFRHSSQPIGEGSIYCLLSSHVEAKKHYPIAEHDLIVLTFLSDLNKYEITEYITDSKYKNLLINIYFYYSPKDIQYTTNGSLKINNTHEHIRNILNNCFSRTRRIRTQYPIANESFLNYIPTSYVIRCMEDGELYNVCINFIDISGLSNVGLKGTAEIYLGNMDFKDNIENWEKEDLVKAKVLGTVRFNQYALGDLIAHDIFKASVEKENELRTQLELPTITEEEKKLTVGATTARMLRDYIHKYIGKEIQLNQYSVFTSPKNIQRFCNHFRKKEEIKYLAYLGMVDGGRCIREKSLTSGFYENAAAYNRRKPKPKNKKFLVDIDIDGCYGNGLKNQKFPIGNPSFDVSKMTLREFIKKYEKQLVNGLWTARIFGNLGNFQQDLIISKTEESVTAYLKRLIDMSDNSEEINEALRANMCCLTQEIYAGNVTSDSLEMILHYTSNEEKKHWLDNIYVCGFIGYLKRNQVTNFDEMELGYAVTEDNGRRRQVTEFCTAWYEIPLDDYISQLIAIRKQYPKKTPMNEFCKLIINATYGVICSEYFDTDDTGISNVIVANNITARARVLAYCMAKALNTAIIVTDGGVFDVNTVHHLVDRSPTLNNLYRLSDDILSRDKQKHKVYKVAPLLDRKICIDDYADPSKYDELIALIKEIDTKAWEHCSNMFPKITIFKEKQFHFESKNVYDYMVVHNKSDYILTNSQFKLDLTKKKIVLEPYQNMKQRGTKGSENLKVSEKLYDAIVKKLAFTVEFNQSTLIGLSEFQHIMNNRCALTIDELLDDETDEEDLNYSDLAEKFIEYGIYPGDEKIQKKTLFSHIPTCMKHKNMAEFNKSVKIAKEMRKKQDPKIGQQRMYEQGWY